MSHAYAARGSRQTAVFTAIVGFHFVLYLVIAMGLGTRIPVIAPQPLPITRLPPPLKPVPVVVMPSASADSGAVEIVVDKPVLELPDFDQDATPSVTATVTATGPSGGTGTTTAVDYVAPRLRMDSGNLAGLIDACYPASSRRLNEEGRVMTKVTIGAQGKALKWGVAQSSGFARLDAATACVIRKIKFVAGRRDGQAVEAEAMLPIVFRLD